MKALLVGADRLGNIPTTLESHGVKEYTHWTCRKKGMRKLDLPREIDMIIIFYDFIEHNIIKIIKEKAKQNKVICVFSKRACSELNRNLEQCINWNLCEKSNN